MALVPCTLERPIHTDSLKTLEPSDSLTDVENEDPPRFVWQAHSQQTLPRGQ